MFRIFMMSAALVCTVYVASANAESLQCPKPGARMTTSVGGSFEFLKSDGPVCRYMNREGKERSSIYGFWEGEGPNSAAASEAFQKLDLAVGKSVSFVNTGTGESSMSTWHNTYTVEAEAMLEIGGKSVRTYVLRWDREARGFASEWRLWWSPELGYVVKRDGRVLHGSAFNGGQWIAKDVQF